MFSDLSDIQPIFACYHGNTLVVVCGQCNKKNATKKNATKKMDMSDLSYSYASFSKTNVTKNGYCHGGSKIQWAIEQLLIPLQCNKRQCIEGTCFSVNTETHRSSMNRRMEESLPNTTMHFHQRRI